MSLHTWKLEYFSDIKEASTDPISATKHSLKKWEGFRSDALKEHGLIKLSGCSAISDHEKTEFFGADYTNCALCEYTDEVLNTISCTECPIYQATGEDCSRDYVDEDLEGDDAYYSFTGKDDPEPMIALLEKTLKYLEEKR
jgi:hypothetical protein